MTATDNTNEAVTQYRVLIMRPGEKPEPSVIRLPADHVSPRYYARLRDAVEAVTGGPMEHVTVFTSFAGEEPHYTDMFVHEMGHLLGMPINDRATAIYRNNVMVHEVPTPVADDLPAIAGPAILFEKKVWR